MSGRVSRSRSLWSAARSAVCAPSRLARDRLRGGRLRAHAGRHDEPGCGHRGPGRPAAPAAPTRRPRAGHHPVPAAALPPGRPGRRRVTATPQRFTSWDAIFHTLRSAFPDEHYHPGSTLTGFEQADRRVTARFAERGEVEADFLICADGSRSEARQPAAAGGRAALCGLRRLARHDRGGAGRPQLAGFFDQSFTFCEALGRAHPLLLHPGARGRDRARPASPQLGVVRQRARRARARPC